VQVDLHRPLHKELTEAVQWKACQPGITVAWVERDFFTDPGWPLDLLVRVGKLNFGKNQPAIRTFEAIDRPNEAIMIIDLVPDLANDLRWRQCDQGAPREIERKRILIFQPT
jgi:hypothetical protein